MIRSKLIQYLLALSFAPIKITRPLLPVSLPLSFGS
jgi:hypothetical protein